MRVDWTRVDDRRFEQLCHELVRLSLPLADRTSYQPCTVPFRSDGQRDGVLATAPFEGLEPPVFFSFKTSDPGATRGASKAIKAEFIRTKRLQALLADKPRSIVLLANHDIAEGDRRQILKKIGGAAEVRIEGRSQLEQRLQQHPFLLSRYFSWSEFVECVHSEDVETLWKLLPAAGGALATAVPRDGLLHPSIADAQALGRRLRILGGPGSGKSFFGFQLLKQLPPSLVLLLRSLDRDEVMTPIRDIAAWAELPLVILVDNLHRSLTPTAACDALQLLFESRDLASKVVATFVTYWTSKRLEVEARVPSTTWRQWGFSEICLDDPPRSFIRGVVDTACYHLGIRADEAIRDAFVDSVIDCENTPACAVAAVTPYAGKKLDSALGFYPIEIRERELDWHHLFEDVTSNDSVSKSVLRTLAILRISGLSKPLPDLLVHLLSELEGLPSGEVTSALERLQSRRWLRLDREGVYGHDLQLAPRTVQLYDEQGPTLFLRQFAAHLKTSVLSEVLEIRRAVLNGLTHLFWQAGDVETCAKLNALLVEEDPKDQRARVHLGLCSIRQGQVDEGLNEFRTAISVQPELRLVSLYLRQCLRHGRVEAAVASLDELAAKRPTDADTIAFLAHGYADVREPRKGLAWARRVAKTLPDDPRSPALLAELLWLSGRRKQARTTLERGLERWPTDGHLLGVKAIFDLQEGLAESALEAASAALEAQPNEVRNHSLVAILQFQLDRFEEARNTVELGRRLFSEWPELLAVEGLLLLEEEKVSAAGRCLCQALEHQELLGSIMRPSIFQALGRIALLEGEEEEATRWFDEARSHGVPALHIARLRVGVHEERGDHSAAISELEDYLSRHDAEAQVWVSLGRLLSRTGRHLESAEAMRRACELDSNDAENFLALGVELFLAGESAQALPHLETGIKIGPQDPRLAAMLLVDCLIDLQRPAEAALAFGQADRLAPLSHSERVRYAYALAVGGDPEAAREQVERVLGERPEHFPALSAKALFLLQAGEKELAKKAALTAKVNWPGSEEGASGLAQILADVDLVEGTLEVWQIAHREGWRQFALSREAIYKAIHMLAAQSRLPEMLDLLEHCEQTHGFDDATDLNIAHVLHWLGRDEDSLRRYDQLLERSPLQIDAVIERTSLLKKLGRVAEALSPESEIYTQLPSWLMHLYLAHVHAWAANKNPPLLADGLQTAAEELLRCAAALPDPPPTGVLEMPALAQAVVHLGVGELIEAAAKRLDDTCDAKEAASALYLSAFLAKDERELHCRLQLAHERDPDRVTLLGNLARAEGRAGDHSGALTHARALACHPRAGCWGLGRAAQVLLKAGAPPEEVLDTAEQAIAAADLGDHSLPGALHAKARALIAMTRWDEALKAAKAALVGRDDPDYVATVAYSYVGLGRQGEALEVVEEGLRHHPGNDLLSVAKADLLRSTGRYADCLAFVNEMAEEGRLAPLPFIEVAESLHDQGRHEEALCFALRARELIDQAEQDSNEVEPQVQPQVDPSMLRWRIRALAATVSSLLGLGRSQAAMEELEALDTSLLLSTPLWLSKAQILRDYGRVEEFLALAWARLDLAPEDQWAHASAAEALLSLDRVDEALHETELGLKEAQHEALQYLRALALARGTRYEEAVLAIARAMASSLIAGNQVSTDHGKLAAAWLPKCNEPPLVGFWLVVSVLGVACGTVGKRRIARRILRLIEGIDLAPLQSAASAGDPVSSTAVELLERARRFLRGKPSPPSEVPDEPVEKQEQDPHWATLASLLRFLIRSEWPPLSKRALRVSNTPLNKGAPLE